MTTERKLGDFAIEVEWCHKLPMIPGTTDADMDKAEHTHAIVFTIAEALKLAKKNYPRDKFGAVRIMPVQLTDPLEDTPYAGMRSRFTWESIGEVLEYTGEDRDCDYIGMKLEQRGLK